MGFLSDAGAWVKNTADGIGAWVKGTVDDVAGVAHQVCTMTLDAGKAALDGTYTALTDPEKFVSDVKRNVASYGEHVSDSWEKGADTVRQGWEDMGSGRSLWHALSSTINGATQMASLGLTDVWDDHIESVMETHRDELGNVTEYTAKEGTDYITKKWIEDGASRRALVQNSEEEIREAIDEGDRERVSELDAALYKATTGEDIKKAAAVVGTTCLVVGGVLASPVTGGTSLGATAAGLGLTAKGLMTASAVAYATEAASNGLTNEAIKLEEMNVSDDISDAISEQVSALTAAGRLSEGQAEKYADVMERYYRVTLYNSMDPDFAANNGFESNEQMRDYLLAGNGLPVPGDASSMDRGSLEDAYASYYGDLEQAGMRGMDAGLGSAMAVLGARLAAGEISTEEYALGACRAECEMFDIPDSHKDLYAGYCTQLNLGQIDADEFMAAISADDSLSGYIGEDGMIDMPLRDLSQGGLETAVAARDDIAAAADAIYHGQPSYGGQEWPEADAYGCDGPDA